jgi:hypothetical protein
VAKCNIKYAIDFVFVGLSSYTRFFFLEKRFYWRKSSEEENNQNKPK